MMLRWFKNPVKKSSSSQATYIYVLRAGTQSSLHAYCTSLPQISILSHIHVREYVHLKKRKKGKKGGKARWMRSASTRPSGETCKHSGIESRLIASRFRPLGHGFVRLRVFDVFTLFFSGVAPLFLWRNDLCLLHSLCSILGSSHPLPTIKRRLTPQRPETVRKTSCAGWDVRFSVPYSDNSRSFR